MITSNQTHSACPSCGESKVKQLIAYSKDYLHKCSRCGLVFSKVIPTIEELEQNYAGYKPTPLPKATRNRYEELLKKFESFRKTNNLLDVGCGEGYFLLVAKEHGWNVYGTEFQDRLIQKLTAEGVNMEKGYLNPSNYPNDHFDIVTSFEVIEHLSYPSSEIDNITKVLRPKGLLYLTTPNFSSLERAICGPRWKIINYPEHLIYFTPKTLHTLLKSKGLQKIKILTHNIDFNNVLKHRFSKASHKPVASPRTLYDQTALQSTFEQNKPLLALKRLLNFFFTITKLGSAMKVYYTNQK